MTVAGQPAVTYGYDAAGRLTDIGGTINGQAASFVIAYDGIGRRASLTYPNGVSTGYTYDAGSELLTLQHRGAGNAILEALSYTYDALGNRLSMNRPNVTLPVPAVKNGTSYNDLNQMLTINDKTITYDLNGNMTTVTSSCGVTTYTWDARNRLAGISGYGANCSALTASFQYDALGRRISKTVNGTMTQYLYDGLDIVQELQAGVPSANYIRTLGIDEPLVRVKVDGTVRYYQGDAQGSVIALTDENGVVRTRYAYDPFGAVIVTGDASDNPFQYTGRENDGTGLYYYRARYYSPETQRFISEDPIGLAGGLNQFRIVSNNAVNDIDPLGLINGKLLVSSGVGVIANGVGIVGGILGLAAPTGVTQVAGGIVLAKSSVGIVLNSKNIYNAIVHEKGNSSSALGWIAEHYAPCNKNAQKYAAADLALDYAFLFASNAGIRAIESAALRLDMGSLPFAFKQLKYVNPAQLGTLADWFVGAAIIDTTTSTILTP